LALWWRPTGTGKGISHWAPSLSRWVPGWMFGINHDHPPGFLGGGGELMSKPNAPAPTPLLRYGANHR
jgi:hypothetical protein